MVGEQNYRVTQHFSYQWAECILIIIMERATANTANIQSLLANKINQTRDLITQNQSTNPKKKSMAGNKIQALKSMAEGFAKYVCAEFQQKIGIESIMRLLGQKFKMQNVDFSVLLGLAIKEQILNNKVFLEINTQIRQIIKTKFVAEQDSDDDLNIDFDPEDTWAGSSKINKVPSNLPINFYSKEPETTNISVQSSSLSLADDYENEGDNDLNLTHHLQQSNFNDDFIENQNKEVMEYLYKLSQPTTELTYLCQKMKWLQPNYEEGLSKINDKLFSCVAEVRVSSKNYNTFLISGDCLGAISKKQAKRVASLFILRKIYNRFKDVWTKFKRQREENPGIQQILNGNNQQIFKKAHFNLVHASIFKQEENVSEPKNQMTDRINDYLEGLKSHKAELNILQGRYNKRITQVEFERDKQNALNMWPVKAMLYADNQLMEADALESSKKVAEQKCCRKLLFKIYYKDFKRWQEFKAYKESKGLN